MTAFQSIRALPGTPFSFDNVDHTYYASMAAK